MYVVIYINWFDWSAWLYYRTQKSRVMIERIVQIARHGVKQAKANAIILK